MGPGPLFPSASACTCGIMLAMKAHRLTIEQRGDGWTVDRVEYPGRRPRTYFFKSWDAVLSWLAKVPE